MSVRKITFQIDQNAVTPDTAQYGGVQFEDNATVVEYILSGTYKQAINQAFSSAAQIVYRIDFNSSYIGYQPSEILEETDDAISRSVSLAVTKAGQQFQSVLVIIALDNEGEVVGTISSPPSKIIINRVQHDFVASAKIYSNITAVEARVAELEDSANQSSVLAAQNAEDASESALSAENNNQQARTYAENAEGFSQSAEQSEISAQNSAQSAQGNAQTVAEKTQIVEAAAEQIEEKLNESLVTEISGNSTDETYPSAKAVYDFAQPREEGKGLSSNDFTYSYIEKIRMNENGIYNLGEILTSSIIQEHDYATSLFYGMPEFQDFASDGYVILVLNGGWIKLTAEPYVFE